MIIEDDNADGSAMPSPRRQFQRVASVYDELMHDVPYSAWVEYLHELLDARSAQPKTVLDLACGTGNVSERLAAEGFDVIGVDIAEDMVAEARRKAVEKSLPIQYVVQDAAELNLPGKRFDLCVSLFDSLNYVTEPERLNTAIERVYGHLNSGGLFMFDMNSDYALRNRFFDQSNRTTDARLRYDWVSEYNADSRLCHIKMNFWYREDDGRDTEFTEVHRQFAYRQDEIMKMLEDAGFADITAYQAYSMRPTYRASDRIFYVAAKP
jgi:ubiquinone/menaquinone biosynthesis C-methylase UbiE